MSSFYSNKSNFDLVDFVDFRYLLDLHKVVSQTDYLFACGRTVTFSNHVKNFVMHETVQ